jgi:hypothetical protein
MEVMMSRTGEPGYWTGGFGHRLAEVFDPDGGPSRWTVYYDHGDPAGDPHVGACKGFFGQTVTNANRLPDIDVLVASVDDVARVLIEIEERPSPPKELLGNVLAVLLCTKVAVGVRGDQRLFDITGDTRLIVAGIASPKGHTQEKLAQVIGPRLRGLQ